eukprot:4498220-Pyramimonas_sp.AAC.1
MGQAASSPDPVTANAFGRGLGSPHTVSVNHLSPASREPPAFKKLLASIIEPLKRFIQVAPPQPITRARVGPRVSR